ncbi:hypothetical protein TNCV_4046351 [Trichonephila clavipes]|nr:hypothetical protein TNCV_4046351 [Trichonephila clavipes]
MPAIEINAVNNDYGTPSNVFLSLLRTSDCQNKKWYGEKEKSASNPRKNIALNTEKNAVFAAEQYSVFAEEAIQFIVNGRNILMEKKKEKREFPNSMMKDINPFRQNR